MLASRRTQNSARSFNFIRYFRGWTLNSSFRFRFELIVAILLFQVHFCIQHGCGVEGEPSYVLSIFNFLKTFKTTIDPIILLLAFLHLIHLCEIA